MNARTPDPHVRARRALGASLAALALLTSFVFATFGGCVLPDNGLPSPDGGTGGATIACTEDSQCDDHNPCTVDTCGSDQVCQNAPLADGPAPASAQTPGDCMTVDCVSGQPMNEDDPTNLPTTTNDCKIPACNMGMPFFDNKAYMTPCTLMTPTGEVQGECSESAVCTIACGPDMACASMGPCQTASCDTTTSQCVYTPLPDGTPTPGVVPAMGTCQQSVCIDGAPMDEPDEINLPTPMNDCQIPTCNDGTPSLPPVAKDKVCSTYMGNQGGFCDGAGHCVECNEDAECPAFGMNDDCQNTKCTANACVTTFTAAGTATTTDPAQVSGDCQEIECDGSGGTMMAVNDGDKPPNGLCTTGVCNNGVPGQQDDMNGMNCGNGLSCSSGTCNGCTMASQCQVMGMTNAVCNPPTCSCTASTCAELGKTCGTFADGCSGMVDCSGAQNGGETDVDCGGPVAACATRCSQGKHCSVGTDCASGFCADGVCCNAACNGTCEACSAAAKGTGADGVCGAVKSGLDPHMNCTAQGAASCGADGMGCNGSGACIEYGSGTVCVPASCNGTTLTYAETCNGTGTCTAPNTTMTNCAPNLCTAGACGTSCTSDAGCASTGYCSGGVCLSQKGNGMACTAADQCTSGFCADGFCCNVACNGACQACSAALQQPGGGGTGTCSPSVNDMASPSGHPACAMTAEATCGTDGTCNGGSCHDWASGTQCVGPSCSNGTETAAKTCDGNGSCDQGGGMMSCGAYACNGSACFTSCTTSAQCASGFSCSGGSCLLSDGGACSTGAQCASGNCADGVCCDMPCNGACQACTAAKKGSGSDGTCGDSADEQASPAGHPACAMTAMSTCGLDGLCHGGMCELWPNTTVCLDESCSNGVQTNQETCDNGVCGTSAGTTPCSPYVCNGSACFTSCTTSAQCATGFACPSSGGSCLPADGSPCSTGTQCASGFCADGVCCNTACNGTCNVCAASGACGNEPAGDNNMNHACPSNEVCNGAGGTSTSCVECVSSTQCMGLTATPVCNTGNDTCVQCLVSADCNGVAGMPVCNTSNDTCVQCLTNADCTGNDAGLLVCDTTSDDDMNTCVQCNVDADCDAGTCTNHVCM